MNKKLLLSLFAMVVGFFSLSAQNVMIDVDKAANVKVTTQGGNGAVVPLEDGMNRITTLTASDNPLTIAPADGATIVSVTKNDTEVTPSGDGLYRMSIEAMMVKIVTSGGSTTVQDVSVTVNNMSAPGSFTLKAGGEDMAVGSPVTMAPGTEITVIPAKGYAVEKVEDLYMTSVGAANEDGTYTFAAGNDTFGNYYNVYMKVSGLTFTIEPDYAPNVAVMLHAVPDESEGAYQWVNLNQHGVTTVVTTADMTPVLFQGNNEAEILSVTRNGEEVRYMDSPMTWIKGYVSAFEEGDVFVVNTKGKPVDFTFKVAEGNAALEWYVFSLADGTVLDLSGMEAKVQLPLGAKVYVAPRPGTEFLYFRETQEVADDFRSWVRVLEDGSVTVFGTRSDKVTINVDNAARVSVRQSNGRGDELTLADGENQFELSALQNALSITPTEGNYIVSVTLNGTEVEVSRNGSFLVTVEEGSYVDVKSRKIPGDVNVSFALNEGAELGWLEATVNGEPVALEGMMAIKAGSVITLAPAFGYKISSVMTFTPGCAVEQDEETGVYTLTVGDEMENAMFSITVGKQVAGEGEALVIIRSNSSFFTFREIQANGGDAVELSADRVNEVKIGNRISISTYTTGCYIRSLVINGKAMADAVDQRFYIFTVEEDCTIELEAYQRVSVHTDNTINPSQHITIGNLYIIDDKGNRVTNLETEVGATLRFEYEATTGYKFIAVEKYYPYPGEQIEGLTYTITEADAEEGMVMFRGVFEEDSEHPSLTVRTSACYMLDSNGRPLSSADALIGYVYIYTGEGDPTSLEDPGLTTEYVAEVGSKVHLVCFARDDYELESFCLSSGFPDSTFPGNYYTVNADDANAEGTIWITGVLKKKDPSGIAGVEAEGSFGYDRATATLYAPAGAEVFSVSGAHVLSAEIGSTSLEALPAGVYIAVAADGKTLKFVK